MWRNGRDGSIRTDDGKNRSPSDGVCRICDDGFVIMVHDRLVPGNGLASRGVDGFASGRGSWAGFRAARSEEHTSELQSLMRISYAVFCLKKKKTIIMPHPDVSPTLSSHQPDTLYESLL